MQYTNALRRAKIVATVGPATAGLEALRTIVRAGADVVRLNLSHGTHREHRQRIREVRTIAEQEQRHLAVLLDLMGPRYRLGEMKQPRTLQEDERITLGDGEGYDLPLGKSGILELLEAGQRMLIDQGLVELQVEEKQPDHAVATVCSGGTVSSRKGINLPDSDLGFRITPKDRRDIAFALAEGVDFVAASYVGRAADLKAIRAVVAECGGDLPLVAKLERSQALDHLAEIVEEADAVMVARGDLGVEVPIHRVPVLQKRIVEACRKRGKPVVVATQMLESMMTQPRPTRAEVTDIANAALDGADALMLSGETAAGEHPAEAVAVMSATIASAEEFRRKNLRERVNLRRTSSETFGANEVGRLSEDFAQDIPDMVCAAAVYTAGQLKAVRLVAFSQSGFTGRLLARYRPSTPIVLFTNSLPVARQLQLVWGVDPHYLPDRLEHHAEVIELVDRELLARGLAAAGEIIVALMADPIRERTRTNLMRVHPVRTETQWRAAERAPARKDPSSATAGAKS
ncbi:MAG: pyruvate kinase [Acidobacteriota bacterium]